ncbi:MAG TPA: VOC family protein [Acidimicrobiales bacterium]|nr:VOC family protein [Acidimicrobiales bacterium]
MTLRALEIGIDCEDAELLAKFWSAALGYSIGDLDSDGTYLDLIPPPGAAMPVVYLQRVPEGKVVKNRLHLDLYSEDPEDLVGTLVALGATTVGGPRTGSEGGWWQVMSDPEGNEFCVCQT